MYISSSSSVISSNAHIVVGRLYFSTPFYSINYLDIQSVYVHINTVDTEVCGQSSLRIRGVNYICDINVSANNSFSLVYRLVPNIFAALKY